MSGAALGIVVILTKLFLYVSETFINYAHYIYSVILSQKTNQSINQSTAKHMMLSRTVIACGFMLPDSVASS